MQSSSPALIGRKAIACTRVAGRTDDWRVGRCLKVSLQRMHHKSVRRSVKGLGARLE